MWVGSSSIHKAHPRKGFLADHGRSGIHTAKALTILSGPNISGCRSTVREPEVGVCSSKAQHPRSELFFERPQPSLL